MEPGRVRLDRVLRVEVEGANWPVTFWAWPRRQSGRDFRRCRERRGSWHELGTEIRDRYRWNLHDDVITRVHWSSAARPSTDQLRDEKTELIREQRICEDMAGMALRMLCAQSSK